MKLHRLQYIIFNENCFKPHKLVSQCVYLLKNQFFYKTELLPGFTVQNYNIYYYYYEKNRIVHFDYIDWSF